MIRCRIINDGRIMTGSGPAYLFAHGSSQPVSDDIANSDCSGGIRLSSDPQKIKIIPAGLNAL
jgi:hypothetical protein